MSKKKKQQREPRPTALAIGTKLTFIGGGNASLTVGRRYFIIGHFCYYFGKYDYWQQFVTLKNDNNWTIKVNLNKFKP